MKRRNLLQLAAATPLALALPTVAEAAMSIPKNKGMVCKVDGFAYKQMSAAFHRGQRLGPKDLCLFLVDSSGRPVNAAEICYDVYDVTVGFVVGGPVKRGPKNPSVGHYFADLDVPMDAGGVYRIHWVFRQHAGSDELRVTQEFRVSEGELHFWFDDVEIVIAESPEDADALVKDLIGFEPGALDGTPSERWNKLADDKLTTIWWEGDELIGFDLSEKPVVSRPGWASKKAEPTTLTRAEWCTKLGRTYLGSTDF